MPVNTRVDIPLVDFAPFLSNEVRPLRASSRWPEDIFRACHEVGFLYLKNHGIDQQAIAQAFAQSRAFFNLPLAEKQQVAWADELSNRGYVGIERERLDERQPGDLKEAFNVGKEVSLAAAAENAALVANRWPAGHLQFQQTVTSFLSSVR